MASIEIENGDREVVLRLPLKYAKAVMASWIGFAQLLGPIARDLAAYDDDIEAGVKSMGEQIADQEEAFQAEAASG